MITSMSVRWASEKLSADAGAAAPNMASANSAGASRRSEGMGKSSYPKQVSENVPADLSLGRDVVVSGVVRVELVTRRLGCHDVVGLDPTGGADGETGFRAR